MLFIRTGRLPLARSLRPSASSSRFIFYGPRMRRCHVVRARNTVPFLLLLLLCYIYFLYNNGETAGGWACDFFPHLFRRRFRTRFIFFCLGISSSSILFLLDFSQIIWIYRAHWTRRIVG